MSIKISEITFFLSDLKNRGGGGGVVIFKGTVK